MHAKPRTTLDKITRILKSTIAQRLLVNAGEQVQFVSLSELNTKCPTLDETHSIHIHTTTHGRRSAEAVLQQAHGLESTCVHLQHDIISIICLGSNHNNLDF
jgi:hypothetical protein